MVEGVGVWKKLVVWRILCRDLLFCARVIMLVNVSSFHGLVGTR